MKTSSHTGEGASSSTQESSVILIVEDDSNSQEVFTKIAEQTGLKVKVVDSGAKAEEEVSKYIPRLILLDIGLPDIDGLSLLKKWRTSTRLGSVPVIVITAHAHVDMIDLQTISEQLNCSAFMHKPVSVNKLLKTVQLTIGVNKSATNN